MALFVLSGGRDGLQACRSRSTCVSRIRENRERSARPPRGSSPPTPSWCPARASRTSSPRSTADRVDYGVLPIENSIGGSIHRNFDLLLEHDLPIVGEVEVPVVHHLLALPGRTLEQVKRIYSHPQALAQCDRFLRTLTGVEIIATYDTAGSAKMIADRSARRRGGDRVGARGRSVRPGRRSSRRFRTTRTTPRASSSSAAGRSRVRRPTRRRSCSRWRTSRARCSRRSACSRCAAST